MNNKGFTLIELLCTISIMGLIATMACANLNTIFKTKEQISLDNKNNILEEAACTYLELEANKDLKTKCLNIGCKISSKTLISNNLIDSNMFPDEIFINVKKEKNEKKCFIEKGSN